MHACEFVDGIVVAAGIVVVEDLLRSSIVEVAASLDDMNKVEHLTFSFMFRLSSSQRIVF